MPLSKSDSYHASDSVVFRPLCNGDCCCCGRHAAHSLTRAAPGLTSSLKQSVLVPFSVESGRSFCFICKPYLLSKSLGRSSWTHSDRTVQSSFLMPVAVESCSSGNSCLFMLPCRLQALRLLSIHIHQTSSLVKQADCGLLAPGGLLSQACVFRQQSFVFALAVCNSMQS